MMTIISIIGVSAALIAIVLNIYFCLTVGHDSVS